MDTFWPEATETETLLADEAHVFAVPLEGIAASADELLATLSADERSRAERFRLDNPRHQFVAGRAVLRKLLGTYLDVPPADIQLASDENGKPTFVDEQAARNTCFNVSHSGGVVLVALTIGCPVGVDVERLRTVSHLEPLARRYFHEAEIKEILSMNTAERDKAFLSCWTGKEAVVKAIGSGLSERLRTFRVPVAKDGGAWVDLSQARGMSATRCWLERLSPCGDYVAAIAYLGEKRRLRCFTARL